MELIFKHNQEKKERNSNGTSLCNINLFLDNGQLYYSAIFELDYHRYGAKKHITFEHYFNLDINNGDIITTYKIINDGLTEDKMYRNCYLTKKNDFKLFFDLTENGFLRGEKRSGFWGVKYYRQCDVMINRIHDIIKPKISNEFILLKDYKEKTTINSLFDMIVDFHMDKKQIKCHDNIYHDIQYDYPKKKYLEKNDYKYLPSVLESYDIKSKYLVSELNKIERPIYIKTLNYLCKLFGSNYVDYIRQINWQNHCFELPNNRKIHELKNESEKNCMVSVINKWEKNTLKTDTLVYSINKLLTIREVLEEKGIDLKFKAKNDDDFEHHIESWSGMKLHIARGFRLRYDLPKEFLDEVQDDIQIQDQTYKIKILINEEDFRVEGYNMKNCMGKQFLHGAIYIYVAMQNKKKRINLQYKKGKLIQSYGKANTIVTEDFNDAIEILNERISKYKDITWKKEKYDFVNK